MLKPRTLRGPADPRLTFSVLGHCGFGVPRFSGSALLGPHAFRAPRFLRARRFLGAPRFPRSRACWSLSLCRKEVQNKNCAIRKRGAPRRRGPPGICRFCHGVNPPLKTTHFKQIKTRTTTSTEFWWSKSGN